MKNTINKQAQSIKTHIDDAAKKSKENIKSVIESNTKQLKAAAEANAKAFNSISKMLYDNEMDPSVMRAYNGAFIKGLELSENAIDGIIDSHTSQADLSADFTKKFLDMVKNENIDTKKGAEKLIELVKENFDKANELSLNNMKKLVSGYNEHINMALNFNKKFADNISSQITTIFTLQNKTARDYAELDMITEWWKNIEEEKHHLV